VDPQRIGILGFSIGGQVALRSAAQMDGIKAVAADGPGLANQQDVPPPTSLGDRIANLNGWLLDRFFEGRVNTSAPPGVVDVIADIAPRPILLIATGRDMEQRVGRHYFANASEPKALWEIPEAGHGRGPVARPEEYEERIVTFFDQAFSISSLYLYLSVGETDNGS
jgi:dienelactone hydrolase